MTGLTRDATIWKIVPALPLLAVLAVGCGGSSGGGGGGDDAAAEVACVWNDSAWEECEWG